MLCSGEPKPYTLMLHWEDSDPGDFALIHTQGTDEHEAVINGIILRWWEEEHTYNLPDQEGKEFVPWLAEGCYFKLVGLFEGHMMQADYGLDCAVEDVPQLNKVIGAYNNCEDYTGEEEE